MNPADSVRRPVYSGNPADQDIFLLRIASAAQQLEFADVYSRVDAWTRPPHDATQLAARPTTTIAERTEKRELEAENKKHMKRCIDAYHFILQSLDTETALAVANEAPDEHEAADAYDAMMRILRDRGVVTQMNLVVRLLKLKGEDGTDPLVVMRQQAQLATKLAATGCTLPEPLLKALVLFALPPSLQHLMTKYIDAEETPGTPMTLTTLKTRLTTQFQVAAAGDDAPVTPAHSAGNHPPTTTLTNIPSTVEGLSQSDLALALSAFVKSMCSHCNKPGHSEDNCWHKHPEKRPKSRGGKGGGGGNKTTQANSTTVPMFMLQSSRCKIIGAVIDSGCGNSSVSPYTEGLSEHVKAQPGHAVEVADGKLLKVSHYATWTLTVTMADGTLQQWKIPNCNVVPSVDKALLSSKHLNRLGYKVVLEEVGGKDTSHIITPQGASAYLGTSGGVPVLPPPTSATLSVVNSSLQHKRYMHFSKGAKPHGNCNVCNATKQRNVSHHPVDHTQDEVPVTEFGDLVVSDLSGPYPESAVHRNQYAVSFIDVKTDHLFVYYIKEKSAAMGAFKKFIRYCEAHKHGRVKRIRSDRGGEYTARKFADYEVATGVWHEWTAPRTPQQNGKAEVTWRTLKALVRAALYEAELHQAHWERAMATAVFVYNRTDGHDGVSPHTRLTGKAVDDSKWRVFGCLAYPIDKRYTTALTNVAEVGVFMGYEPTGYVIWIPTRSTYLTCPAVKFDEACSTRAARHAAFVQHTRGVHKNLKVQLYDASSDLADLDFLVPAGEFQENNNVSNGTGSEKGMLHKDMLFEQGEEEAPLSPGRADGTAQFRTPLSQARLRALQTPSAGATPQTTPGTSPAASVHEEPQAVEVRHLHGTDAREAGNQNLHRLQQAAAEMDARVTRQGTAFCTLERVMDALEADTDVANRDRYRCVPVSDRVLDTPDLAFSLTDLEGGLPAAAAAAGCQYADTDNPTVEQAMNGPEVEQYRAAMDTEVQQHIDRGTWEMVDRDTLPPGAKPIPGKWVLKRKTVDTGDGTTTHNKHKGRWTARGDRQKRGRDFSTTWSPVIAFPILRILIAFACSCAFPITQVDFDGAYLNALLDTVVYMELPWGYEQPGKCVKLLRALYGLKQSGRLWYLTLKEWMEDYGFTTNQVDPCVFVLHQGASWVIAWVYVDDMGCFSNDEALKEQFLAALAERFTITTLGVLQYYLGINITTHGKTVTMDQRKYIQEICREHKVTPIPVATPVASTPSTDERALPETEATTVRRMMGALVYIAVMTRPDISFAVSAASRHLHNPRVCDRVAIERIYRYLLCTLQVMLTYSSSDPAMTIYTDSDFDNCKETHRSQSGIVILMFGAAVLWRSVRQAVVALSTTEAEYMAQCMGAQDALYILYFLEALNILGLSQTLPLVFRGDNEAAINMLKEGSDNSRTKHIQRKFYFLKELVQDMVFAPMHIRSQFNFADGLTKGLAKVLQKVSMCRLLGQYFK
jgi:hypothetical protein